MGFEVTNKNSRFEKRAIRRLNNIEVLAGYKEAEGDLAKPSSNTAKGSFISKGEKA